MDDRTAERLATRYEMPPSINTARDLKDVHQIIAGLHREGLLRHEEANDAVQRLNYRAMVVGVFFIAPPVVPGVSPARSILGAPPVPAAREVEGEEPESEDSDSEESDSEDWDGSY